MDFYLITLYYQQKKQYWIYVIWQNRSEFQNIKNYLQQVRQIMKKPNNTKPASKPKPASSGFGFGDAMFNMKSLTSQYAQFNDPPPPSLNNNPINQQPKKPITVVANKPINNPSKIVTVQQKQQSNVPLGVFKIAIGNEYKNNIKLAQINLIKVSQNTFEITTNKVGSKWEYNVFCDGVPANKIVEKPQISFNFNGDELKQGQLGNCYFIAAMASIANYPQIFQQRIPEFKKYTCQQKSFKVTMFQSGKLIQIIVDNLFPNIYVQPVRNDISPMIIQKAYAQTYGSFEVINVGYAIDALRDLTGAPTQELSLKDKAVLKDKVKEYFQNKFGLVIASKVQNITPSISPKHSYNVLNYKIVNSQLFLQLRDPRGWTKAAFDTPYQLVNKPQNGQFWIGQKQLQQNFQMISVGKYRKGYTYFYKTFSQKDLTNKTGGLMIHPKVATKVYITLHQKHKKFYDQNFQYGVLRMLIAEVDANKQDMKLIKTLKTVYKTQQVCTIQIDLEPKMYAIIAQIDSKKVKELFPNQIFTISIYSEKRQINFEQIFGLIQLKSFLINYISQNKHQFEQYIKNGAQKYYGQVFGYICLYYNNKGDKQILQEIEYTIKNIQITQKKVQLLPKQSKLIMHPIQSEQYQCSMKSNTLYK